MRRGLEQCVSDFTLAVLIYKKHSQQNCLFRDPTSPLKERVAAATLQIIPLARRPRDMATEGSCGTPL
jgi:hypothetical protein